VAEGAICPQRSIFSDFSVYVRSTLEAETTYFSKYTTAQRCRSETENFILKDLFSAALSHFKKGVPIDPTAKNVLGWVPCVQVTSHLNALGWLRALKSPYSNACRVNSNTLLKNITSLEI